MLAVADGRPETMGIIPIIKHHVNFQYEITRRKYETLLAKEKEKERGAGRSYKGMQCHRPYYRNLKRKP